MFRVTNRSAGVVDDQDSISDFANRRAHGEPSGQGGVQGSWRQGVEEVGFVIGGNCRG